MGWFFVILSLVFAGIVGFIAQHEPGLLIIRYQDWILEFPLWLAALLSLALIFIIVSMQALCYRFWRWVKRSQEAWHQRRQRALAERAQAQMALIQALQALFDQGADVEVLEQRLRQAPRALRQHPRAVEIYVQALLKAGRLDLAEEAIEDALKRDWDASLLRLYGLIGRVHPELALKRAEKWLPKHAGQANLLLTLGRLSLQNQLWGKAKSYLEQSIEIQASAEAYAELGRLHESLGDVQASEACYKAGLLHQTELLHLKLPETP